MYIFFFTKTKRFISTSTYYIVFTATRKRDVYCQMTGTDARLKSEEPCTKSSNKPEESEECYNKQCHGLWITEPWSQVLVKHDGDAEPIQAQALEFSISIPNLILKKVIIFISVQGSLWFNWI